MATINPWKQFTGLLPKPTWIIGVVTSHNSDGTSTLTLRNGSIIKALGQDVEVNDTALIKNGQIINKVPSLPTSQVVVR